MKPYLNTNYQENLNTLINAIEQYIRDNYEYVSNKPDGAREFFYNKNIREIERIDINKDIYMEWFDRILKTEKDFKNGVPLSIDYKTLIN